MNATRDMAQIKALPASPLFAGLSRSALGEIARGLTLEAWPKGAQILGLASAPDRFRIVKSGRVKIARSNGANGREVTLWLLGEGDAFDIVPLLDGQPHAVFACALDDVQTLAAPLAQFHDWLERFPPLRQAMCRYVARQMRDVTGLASDFALHDTMTRLARALLRHFGHSQHAGGDRPNLIQDLSQEELASLVGSVRVVVSRLLGQLNRERIISLHRGGIHILDLKRLLNRAEAALEPERPRRRSEGSR